MKKKMLIIISVFMLVLSSCSMFKSSDAETENGTALAEDTITFGFIGLQNASEDTEAVSSRIHQKIFDDFGINIEVVALGEDTWKEELDVMISSNRLPDVFFHDITEDKIQYRQLMDLGLIRDIPKSMWAKRDNLAKVMSWYESTYAVDGKMYFVPRTYQTFDQTHGSSYAILYRRDWAYLVDAIPPEDPHFYNLVDMMKQFVSQDPDNNSVKDTWGITGGDDFDFINYAFLEPFGVREWMYEDGKWIPGLLGSKAKEAAAWISQLYKEGMIDPDFTKQSSQDALNKFITGKSGACMVSIYPEELKSIEERWLIYNVNSISQSVDIIPLYYASDARRYNEVETFSTGTMFSSKLSDDDMEKVLDLMNWMYSEEGRMYFEYGVKNEDYVFVMGDVVSKDLTDEKPLLFGEKNIEYKALENLASWNLDFMPFYQNTATEFQTYGKSVLTHDKWVYSYSDELFTNGMLTPELCVLNVESVARDMLFEVIMISYNFEQSWQEYVDYCYSTFNVDEAGEEVAVRAQELGIIPVE